MHLLESGQFLLCLGYGVVTFVTSIVYDFIVVRILKVKGGKANFTFGIWILYMIGIILLISFANFFFVRLVLFDDIQWRVFPYMLRGTFAIGIFPIVVLGTIALLKQERKYQKISNEINQKQKHSTHIKQGNGPLIFGIPSPQIRYIEAMQNYINISYINHQGQMQVETQRATLKSLSNEILGKSLLRCHRSYIVNRESIVASSGNAQGLLLTLADCEKKIPVSRSFVTIFRDD